jgi:hypothetical protein
LDAETADLATAMLERAGAGKLSRDQLPAYFDQSFIDWAGAGSLAEAVAAYAAGTRGCGVPRVAAAGAFRVELRWMCPDGARHVVRAETAGVHDDRIVGLRLGEDDGR